MPLSLSRRAAAAVAWACLAAPALADFTPTSGTAEYTNAANWTGGVINGRFTAAGTNNLTVTFAQDWPQTASESGLLFNNGNGTVTLQSDGGTARVLTLDGDITTGTSTTGNVVTVGTAANPLNVDLGGANRTFSVAGGDSLTIAGAINGSGFGITKAGTGTLFLTGNSSGASGYGGTVTALTVNTGIASVAAVNALGPQPAAPLTSLIVNGGATFQFTGATASLGGNRNVAIGPGSATFDVPSAGTTLTISGVIADNGGAGRLVKIGAGTLQLNTSTNTYTGGVTIQQGVLGISSDARLGAVPGAATAGYLVVNDGATLRFTGTTTTTVNAARGIAIGPATGSGSAMFDVADPANLTLAGIITNNGSGTGRLVKTGTGTLTITTSTDTYSGGVSVLAGILSFASDVRLGAVPAAATPGYIVVNDGATFRSTGSSVTINVNRGIAVGPTSGSGVATFDVTGADTNILRFDGIVTDNGGSGQIVKTGVGIFRLSGANTFTGGLVVTGGTMRLQNAQAAGLGPGGSGNTSITLQGTAPILEPMVSSSGTVNYPANLTVTADATFLSGRNSVDTTVTTTQSFASLTIGGNAVTVGPGSNVAGQTGANFGFRIGGTTTLTGTPTFTVNNNGTGVGTFTLNGVVSGGFGLTKAGPGVMILNAANTYAGPTTVSGGTLTLGPAASIASSPAIAVGSGATLDVSAVTGGFTVGSAQTLSGNGTVAGGVAVAGTVAPGGSIGTLASAGMTWQPGGNYQVEHDPSGSGTPGTTNDLINGTGVLDLSGLSPGNRFNLTLSPTGTFPATPAQQTYTIATFAGGITGSGGPLANGADVSNLFTLGGSFASAPAAFATVSGPAGGVQSLQLTFTPVPEPAFVLLACGGAAGLAAWRRRRA
ncbi:MAG TPA: autotransporter-associated beta strand repeat-containing protein [Gemmataceae bacterium]|jgi:autotransporter-associated beta strand protein